MVVGQLDSADSKALLPGEGEIHPTYHPPASAGTCVRPPGDTFNAGEAAAEIRWEV